jgi:hypothetical protein
MGIVCDVVPNKTQALSKLFDHHASYTPIQTSRNGSPPITTPLSSSMSSPLPDRSLPNLYDMVLIGILEIFCCVVFCLFVYFELMYTSTYLIKIIMKLYKPFDDVKRDCMNTYQTIDYQSLLCLRIPPFKWENVWRKEWTDCATFPTRTA